jgi:hypothetical protein
LVVDVVNLILSRAQIQSLVEGTLEDMLSAWTNSKGVGRVPFFDF